MWIMGGYESKWCPGLIATHVLVKEEERGGWRAAAPVFFRLDGMVAAKCFVGDERLMKGWREGGGGWDEEEQVKGTTAGFPL